jgi:hypothetical protein
MSYRHNRAIIAYKLRSVAERNSPFFVELTDFDFQERGQLYGVARADDAYYQVLLADMLFEQTEAFRQLRPRRPEKVRNS